MFTKRTIRPHVAVTSVDTASEALAVSIAEKARVEMPFMAELSGKTETELETELAGVIFRNVNCAENPEEIPLAFVDLTVSRLSQQTNTCLAMCAESCGWSKLYKGYYRRKRKKI